ncbi:hypothetical protein AV530_005975 [Patagioenas fasciata monilis]|uniref:Uncharacterized protein n=1 Tax=Patagioenas fasciata monilis TaxID=372326 RepID=A0A1V4JNP6_PATFA|nr:hypothetical protein AV530_005975 [Patagioenas fasciata monilis]
MRSTCCPTGQCPETLTNPCWIPTLYSKVTRQNAIPDYCRSPLPISTGHSMLPDSTGLKLQSINPLYN